MFIHTTTSLCKICYRHLPGFVFEKDGSIFLTKTCPEHGETTICIEPDADFFFKLECPNIVPVKPILMEITDKCQLDCPHCYHLPDNRVTDTSADFLISKFLSLPSDSYLILAGAEPTLRSDFPEFVQRIKNLNYFKQDYGHGTFTVLTNGVKFSSMSFTKKCKDSGLEDTLIGLNHPSYNGDKVHEQQLKGIYNLAENEMTFGYIGYTIETLDHIPDILAEIEKVNSQIGKYVYQYRIRCGSFIGRSADKKRSYISDTLKYIENYLGKENITVLNDRDNNIYHVNIMWNGILIRVIQWPDVETIDMEELNMGPYCQFYGEPITNFVHQVIMRDAVKNMNFTLYDKVPFKYTYASDSPYWRNIIP